MLLTAIETANENQLNRLTLLFSEEDPEKKVKGVMDIYAELNIKEKAEEQMNLFYQTAMDKLDAIDVEDDKKNPLRAIAMYLMGRES